MRSPTCRPRALAAGLVAIVVLLAPAAASAQLYASEPRTFYLHRGSQMSEGCWGFCACVLFFDPMRGRFTLALETLAPSAATYRMTDIQFNVPTRGTQPYNQMITGSGTFRVDSMIIPNQQMMSLDLTFTEIVSGGAMQHFESGAKMVSVGPPMIQIIALNNEHGCPGVAMNINASPFHSDWNSDGTVSVQDLFEFLGDYFAGGNDGLAGDHDENNVVNVGDVFAFLGDWFGGV